MIKFIKNWSVTIIPIVLIVVLSMFIAYTILRGTSG